MLKRIIIISMIFTLFSCKTPEKKESSKDNSKDYVKKDEIEDIKKNSKAYLEKITELKKRLKVLQNNNKNSSVKDFEEQAKLNNRIDEMQKKLAHVVATDKSVSEKLAKQEYDAFVHINRSRMSNKKVFIAKQISKETLKVQTAFKNFVNYSQKFWQQQSIVLDVDKKIAKEEKLVDVELKKLVDGYKSNNNLDNRQKIILNNAEYYFTIQPKIIKAKSVIAGNYKRIDELNKMYVTEGVKLEKNYKKRLAQLAKDSKSDTAKYSKEVSDFNTNRQKAEDFNKNSDTSDLVKNLTSKYIALGDYFAKAVSATRYYFDNTKSNLSYYSGSTFDFVKSSANETEITRLRIVATTGIAFQEAKIKMFEAQKENFRTSTPKLQKALLKRYQSQRVAATAEREAARTNAGASHLMVRDAMQQKEYLKRMQLLHEKYSKK